jgi:ligand-binding sensor domain-containing protein
MALAITGTVLAVPPGGDSGAAEASGPVPAPYVITLFIPSSNMIHSDQVLDMINIPKGGVLIGTSFGLSTYNGTWSTRHINRDNITEGLMDEFITAVEYDPDGNQWIGYSGGIQIYDGRYYRTIRDQQLLKDTRIQDIQRWHDDMWIATGNAGIHRFRNGAWTWYQPMSKGGPEFYDAREIALDPLHDILVLVTADNGHWRIRKSGDDTIAFEQIAVRRGSHDLLDHVRRDPAGGVYFFNDTTVMHYTPMSGYESVLTTRDITIKQMTINDLAAAPDGRLYLATDNGIYVWNNGVEHHLSRFEGIGTSEVVRFISIDAEQRIWFASKGHVGYFYGESGVRPAIEIVAPGAVVAIETPVVPVTTAPVETVVPETVNDAPVTGGLAPVLDPILHAIRSFLYRIGIGSSPA